MVRIYKQVFFAVCVCLFFTFGDAPDAIAQYDDVTVSYNDFYQNLAPYGQWINDPKYGNVWSPNVDGSFRPYYTNGHWVMTDYGNTWVSDYPWGWACFHYGRWTYDQYYGWLWIPGTDWGPSWVSWRYGNGYYGWAPLGPGYGFNSGDYYCPNDWWVFIPPQYIYSSNYYHYWSGPHGNSEIIKNTNFVNNTYENNHVTYVSGPRSSDVQQFTHQPVQVYHLTNSTNLNTRVHNDVIKMYRPAQIRPDQNANGQKMSPPYVVNAPQPIRSNPQAVNTGQAATPQFRSDVPNGGHTGVPGTNFNETAKPAQPHQGNNNNPYEWDVNKPAQQPQQQRDEIPQQNRQQQQQPRQEPPRQQQADPVPQPQPQQNNYRPQPQQQSRPAPAPSQPARNQGGRK